MNEFDLATVLGLPDLKAWLEEVDRSIQEVTASEVAVIDQPIKRLLSVRGKRLRPSLVIAASQTVKLTDDLLHACVAIELVHLSSLVHDDIMDKADTRWNIPTINSQEGSDQALLVGDYLLAKANEQAAFVSTDASKLVATAIASLCEGQARELADAHNLQRSITDYLLTAKDKTARLMATSCRLGGMIGGLNESSQRALDNFGENFGMAFQIVDDVLDFTSNHNKAGKPVGNDVREGVYTLPLLLALNDSRDIYEKLIKVGDQTELVTKLVDDGYINKAVQEAKNYTQQAVNALGNTDKTSHLDNLPESYLRYALKTN